MTSTNTGFIFLHGIGTGDRNQSWREPLDQTLDLLGYPRLPENSVYTPRYADLLRASDQPKERAPRKTTPRLTDSQEAQARWTYERRQATLEEELGRAHSGLQIGVAEPAVDANLNFVPLFAQAKRYLRSEGLRAGVLNRVVEDLPTHGEFVLVGHSLGSLIAIDLLDVLPDEFRVRRFVTIGSPLGYPSLLRHRKVLLDQFPHSKVESWVNFWHGRDPVSLGRGISHHFPEALDIKLTAGVGGHAASMFLRNQLVAKAVGSGLFGSLNREIAPIETTADEQLNELETLVVLRIAYGHFLVDAQEGDTRSRLQASFSIVQRQLVQNLIEEYESQQRRVPQAILALRDGDSPHGLARLSAEDSLIPLLLIAASNPVAPFEVGTSNATRKKAMGDLSVFLGLTSSHGTKVFESLEAATRIVRSSDNAARWILGAAGVAVLVAGPIGWALAAPAGLAGGAAIVGGLAAFGPGGMIGGLLTAGTLTSLGTGATVAALVGAQSSVAMVESTIAQLLALAIARRNLKLAEDDSAWYMLVDLQVQITRELQHLKPYSDSSAPSIKNLESKLSALNRALEYLISEQIIRLTDSDVARDGESLEALEAQLNAAIANADAQGPYESLESPA